MTAPISGRTVRLRERVPRLVRLSPTDAAFLLTQHRSHLDLTPSAQRHVYRLTARGYVGVIVTLQCRLVLRPKIPLANLYHLLDPHGVYPITEDAVSPTDGAVLSFLAGQLARLLMERGDAG